MESLALLLIIGILLLTLIKSAQMVEGAFILIARKSRISEFIIGFVVLGIVTSLPELSIAVASSQEIPQLSIGNIIGATAVLLTLVIGLNAIKFKNLSFKGRFAEKELLIGIFSVFLMLLSIMDSYISVVEGLFMILIYLVYVIYLNYKFSQKVDLKKSMINVMKIYSAVGSAILGIVFLIVASIFIVEAASSLAFNLNISPALLGIFLLGFGTNVPELTILLTSKVKTNEQKLTSGNVFGSLFLNPGTVGLLAVLAGGVQIFDLAAIIPAIVICFIALGFFALFSYTGRTLSKNEGIILIAVFASLIITELILLISHL